MVLGIFDTISHAETALNNLIEAEFEPKDISVVTNNPSQTKLLGDFSGRIMKQSSGKLTQQLKKCGISEQDAKEYNTYVNNGGILITIEGSKESEDVASEMLKDHQAQYIKIM